jgi:fructose-bisphosphate aldolase class II
MFTNYDGVVGNKKVYDPPSYLKKAEEGITSRVVRACEELRSVGNSLAT